MNNYQELYNMVIEGFIKEGFEIYKKSSWLTSLRRWKLVHQIEDIKVIETIINVYLDDEDNPTNVLVRFAYFERK